MAYSTRCGCALVWLSLLADPLAGQVTETPRTAAPGRLLFEVDGLRLAYERADAAGNKHTAVAVASTLVNTGLTATVDVQAGAELFLRRSITTGGVQDSRKGFGDLHDRTKWEFWQDEGGGAALAAIPYVKIPSNMGGVGDNAVEGGLIFPWEKVVESFKTGAMFQWDVIRKPNDDGNDARWPLSGFVQRSVTKTVGIYDEATFEAFSSGWSDWMVTVGAGVTWTVMRTVQLDYELLRGVNRRATDWAHVLQPIGGGSQPWLRRLGNVAATPPAPPGSFRPRQD